jgi:hypothetical protein
MGIEIKIDLAELRKRKLFIATPMYGGQCAGMYTKSVADLTAQCVKNGIEMQSFFLFNESLITRARNYCVDEFLRSDCTHLLFIDSDIGFNPMDALGMLALQGDDTPYDIITAPYPKKCISWEKIKLAVDKGAADQDPNNLENFVGDYVFNVKTDQPGPIEIRLDQPAQVAEAGTGFMMIRRSTFEKYKQAYPELSYLPDHVRSEAFDGSREIHAYFDCIIDPMTRRYLSEDYMFCHNAWNAGMQVWMCPWISLKHIGMYVFGGSLPAIASIGADPTADAVMAAKIEKKKSGTKQKNT